MIQKDFYSKLPSFVCEQMDDIEDKYSKNEWFEKAWNEYRDYVLSTEDIFDLKMPGFIFKKYIKE